MMFYFGNRRPRGFRHHYIYMWTSAKSACRCSLRRKKADADRALCGVSVRCSFLCSFFLPPACLSWLYVSIALT